MLLLTSLALFLQVLSQAKPFIIAPDEQTKDQIDRRESPSGGSTVPERSIRFWSQDGYTGESYYYPYSKPSGTCVTFAEDGNPNLARWAGAGLNVHSVEAGPNTKCILWGRHGCNGSKGEVGPCYGFEGLTCASSMKAYNGMIHSQNLRRNRPKEL